MKARKKDANHHEIVQAFESLGYNVEDMTAINNFCDIHISKGRIYSFIEIKDGKKPPSARKLTSGEVKFRSRCLESRTNWHLCRSVQDAVEIDTLLKVFYDEV